MTKLIEKVGCKDDTELAELLLSEVGLALVPGRAFGAKGHLRLSYAASMDTLKDAIARLKTFSAKYF